MSCLDVMYHQSYGAHRYLPATSAAAVAYKAAYFHHQQQQQKKLCAYSRMQDSTEPSAQGKQTQTIDQEEKRGQQGMLAKEAQPAEAEYLSSRCVLFTYFQGDIGDVVDEHFSRALGMPSTFAGDAKGTRTPSGGLWKEGGTLSAGQCGGFPSSFWSSGYPSQSSPCLSSIHPDFSPSTAFHSSEPSTWAGHGLHQPGLPPTPTVSDSWPYPLGAQGSTSYPHVHEVYPHVHPRHAHPRSHAHHMLHHAHGPALDPRFSPLLLPSVRPPCSPAPHCDAARSDMETSGNPTHSWPASFHGSLDIYDSVLDQEKGKATVWF
ncbi:transcription cofactor vestigial-like protein 3 isoform X1 [Megalops cyprinoides]|uniref:transcription cofactor vestigial-like protein 3 isoform X1 n=2 Tax=Megalops cyprinoides TaxID=118141 RepID=UPI001863E43F|nr:transcription cofactor vestigial-like protein 3 isoform X1 [Megalops cyprinoides]